jgi:hypothetical protein
MRIPKVGEKIYVPSSMYVYRGSDDFAGGIATISKVEVDKYGHGPENPNYCFVSIEERLGSSYNWANLEKEQERLKEMYGDQIAHPDPDDRPEFNDSEADWH